MVLANEMNQATGPGSGLISYQPRLDDNRFTDQILERVGMIR